ncbi:SDR family NAD(P)-dependent oxidoreductase [Microbacterium sp.]|uniref:SDR family NAD(P)-dependent oxidoreductase n=1 Tax=Microbacterium sp. TaxID=51671 RepID=UPI003A8571C1
MNSALLDQFDLTGQVALVTGSSSGLGAAAAAALAAAGARVVVHGRDPERAREAAARIGDAGGDADTVVGDVTDTAWVRRAFDEIIERHGRLDVVMANAGVAGGPNYRLPGGAIADLADEDWDRVVRGNLTSVLATLREASRVMSEGGRIIVTSSTAGLRTDPFVGYSYVATKAAVVNLVRQAALELAPRRIRVNALAPGPFKNTRIGGDNVLTDERERAWVETIPLGAMGLPEQLQGPVLFLASEASSFVTGVTLPVDGGALLLSHAHY